MTEKALDPFEIASKTYKVHCYNITEDNDFWHLSVMKTHPHRTGRWGWRILASTVLPVGSSAQAAKDRFINPDGTLVPPTDGMGLGIEGPDKPLHLVKDDS